jgi:hypothetical protein
MFQRTFGESVDFIDEAFRSAAVGLRPQAPEYAGMGCLGLSRSVKRVSAAFRNAPLTKDYRTRWLQPLLVTGRQCSEVNGPDYFHAMFGLSTSIRIPPSREKTLAFQLTPG